MIDRIVVLECSYFLFKEVERIAILIFFSNVPGSHKLQEKENMSNPMFHDSYFMEQWFLCGKQLYLMLPLLYHGQYVLLLGIVLFVDNLVQKMVVLRHRYLMEHCLIKFVILCMILF